MFQICRNGQENYVRRLIVLNPIVVSLARKGRRECRGRDDVDDRAMFFGNPQSGGVLHYLKKTNLAILVKLCTQ